MQNEYTQKVIDLVDGIKAVCTHGGLGGEASEYKIVTQSFLYKFLNDKFLYELKKLHPEWDEENYENISKDEWTEMLEYEMGNKSAHFQPQYLLTSLFKIQDSPDFATTFDDTLKAIAVENNEIFSVHTEGNTDIRLFDDRLIQSSFSDANQWNTVAKQIINKLAKTRFNFDEIFDAGFDFFSTIFEYMIKDYNKDGGGKYAEYYTPHSVAKIIAEILVGDDEVKNVTVYDPAAGSGTLLMNLASKIGTDNCTIYSQDISQKSSNLLRLNLILNNLTHSINNIVQGNTILNDRHANQKMDYVVSNPPFKLDFSDWRDEADALPKERFFAGIPNIPDEKKDSMAIYLLFIQHIIFSLKPEGKAAIVVPTGFLTAKNGIEFKIRNKIISNNWLSGAISMPANIFANTGTNVSIMFLDKGKIDDKCVLIDATKIGKKEKIGKIKKTILTEEDQQLIIDTFINRKNIEDFSIVVNSETIKSNRSFFSAGQYFYVKFDTNIVDKQVFETSFKNLKNGMNSISSAQSEYSEAFNLSLNDITFVTDDVEMVYNEILKQEIPVNRDVKTIRECTTRMATGLNPRDHFKLGTGNIKYITVKNLDLNDGIDFDNCDLIDEKALELVHARSDISKGDILFASICPLGRCYLIDEEPRGWDINESVFTIRPNYDILTSEYLYMMFKHPAIVKKLTNKSTGSIFKGIRQDDLLNVYIPIPDKKTMEKLSVELSKMIKLKRSINNMNRELDKSKEFIMPLIMNGQVTVK